MEPTSSLPVRNRRDFLTETLAGSTGLALGLTAPNTLAAGSDKTIRVGTIGTGGRCRELMTAAKPIDDIGFVAVCDIWEDAITQGLKLAGAKAKVYRDYRKVLDDKEIDAVFIATPDHWHVPILVDALEAGKDVYIEKPLTWSLDENPTVLAAVKKHPQRIVQVGMQQRAMPHLVKCYEEVVTPGLLGAVHHVRLWWDYQSYPNNPAKINVDPSRLDWKAFCGRAKEQPFDPYRFRRWRNIWDFAGGHLTDLMTHLIDVVHWYTGVDHPVTAVSAGGKFFSRDARETPDVIHTLLTYPTKLVATFQGNQHNGWGGAGLEFYGSNGTLYVDRQLYELTPAGQKKPTLAHHDGSFPRGYYNTRTDQDTLFLRAWVDSVHSRKPPLVNVEMAINAAGAAHLGNRAYRKNEVAKWPV
jgi:predicted dehydrogenase